jgi:HD-GYP domain-containing protein (c-di-GMP phosphodiesterase class II)
MGETTKVHSHDSARLRIGRLITMPAGTSLPDRVEALEEEAHKLVLLLEMSQLYASATELSTLLGLVVEHTTKIMNCERSSVFLLDREKDELYAMVAQGLDIKEFRFSAKTGISGACATHGVALNVPDAYQDSRFNPAFDKSSGFRTVSILCMPMSDQNGNILGVIQCLNKKSAHPAVATFSHRDELLLSAVASQAAFYLENTALYRQMDKLFESFVEATSRSIDDRDPCTSGHSRRVTMYSLNLARAVHESNQPPFDKIFYSRERIRQLRYASLLHDVGKIGVREYILSKSQKLPVTHMEMIRHRFDALREKSRGDCLQEAITRHLDAQKVIVEKHAPLSVELDQAWKTVEAANASNFLKDEEIKPLEALLTRGWITAYELKNLSVRRGNLTDDEWVDMRSHVTKSFRMLQQIPWPASLSDLPEIAYTHHEKRDGSGYPRKLKEDEIHFDGQIMCVADIYDALTASDRPYKRAIPLDRAKKILMEEEAAKGRMLPELVELFFNAKCYELDGKPIRDSEVIAPPQQQE